MSANRKQVQVAVTKGAEGNDIYAILDKILGQKHNIEKFDKC